MCDSDESYQDDMYTIRRDSLVIDDEKCKLCIFRTLGNEIIIRDPDNRKSSAITCIYQLVGKILDMTSVFLFTKCFYDERADARGDYPDFGTIVAVRHGASHKGRRLGDFPHSVALHVSTGQSYACAKIFSKRCDTYSEEYNETFDYESSHKIQMTGVPNEREGVNLAYHVVRELLDARTRMLLIDANPELFQTVYRMVRRIIKGKKVTIDGADLYTGTFNRVLATTINWNKLNDVDFDDQHLPYVQILYDTCSSFKYRRQLESAVKLMLNKEARAPCTQSLSIHDYGRAMVNVNHEVGCRINQGALYSFIIEQGLKAEFFNEKKKYIRVTMSDNVDDDTGSIRREYGFENTFQIYEKGSIRHSGTGGKSSRENYFILMEVIAQFFASRGTSKLPLWIDDDEEDNTNSDYSQ